ncbi:hypothetical protein DA098_03145 [Vibrio parahaemolyticus]|nr:hypothetical protein DA098_03145 [Vibrio parahaemolyticus]TMX79855.1 hypothetical protein DA094_05055 [Vibrio parahaemolyticus]
MIGVLFGFALFQLGQIIFFIGVLSLHDRYRLALTIPATVRVLIIGLLLMFNGYLFSPWWLIQDSLGKSP